MAFRLFQERPSMSDLNKKNKIAEGSEQEGDLTREYFKFLDKIGRFELEGTQQEKNERLLSGLKGKYGDLKNPGLILLLWQDKNKREKERGEIN